MTAWVVCCPGLSWVEYSPCMWWGLSAVPCEPSDAPAYNENRTLPWLACMSCVLSLFVPCMWWELRLVLSPVSLVMSLHTMTSEHFPGMTAWVVCCPYMWWLANYAAWGVVFTWNRKVLAQSNDSCLASIVVYSYKGKWQKGRNANHKSTINFISYLHGTEKKNE